jgi:hypothetical protein
MTNPQGVVTPKLRPGSYAIRVAAAGFMIFSRQQIKVEKAASIVIRLEVPPVSGPVVVNPTTDWLLTPTAAPLHELIPELANAQSH